MPERCRRMRVWSSYTGRVLGTVGLWCPSSGIIRWPGAGSNAAGGILTACASVGSVAGLVLGGESPHTAVISITTPGSVDMGAYNAFNGPFELTWPTFYLDIHVWCSDPMGMSSVQLRLTGCDGLSYMAAEKRSGVRMNYAGYYSYSVGACGRRVR